MNTRRWRQFDFSLGVQAATTWLLKKPNELARGLNLRFTAEVGAFQRRDGYVRAGNAFADNKAPQGGYIAKLSTGSKRFVAVNNSGDTATIVRVQDINTGDWATLAGISYPVNSIIFFTDHLDEVYISGFDPVTGDPVQPFNVDKTLDVSATRNILNMPHAYFIQEFLGLLYAANVMIGSERHTDRVYKSSPPLGFITTIQGAQSDSYAPVTLVDNVPTMTSDSTPMGVVTASTSNVGWEGWHAFNDDINGIPWLTSNMVTTGTLQYDFGSGNSKIITYYSLAGVPSSDPNLARPPKTWTFEGCPDGSTTWTVLNTQTAAPAWAVSEKRTYTVSNTTAYRYYRINVTENQTSATTGNDSYLSIAEFELLTSTEGTKSLQFLVDSVRYIKPSMSLDIYKAGTETKLFDLNVLAVDKNKNIITFDPVIQPFATTDVNTTTDIFTVPSTAGFATGTTVKIDSTGTVPAPLVANAIYYIINVSSGTFKLATSLSNALLGVGIDITTQGTGNHRLKLSYSVDDNDELWLDGRKGKLTMFWNTDYPTTEDSEFLSIKPGTDSSNTVSAIGKSANRLFIWTKNSGTRWDGQNLIVFNNSVGCISQRSVANIDDDWLIWVDQKGNVRARAESGGQQENIGRSVRDTYLRKLTLDQLKAVSAVTYDNTYKLYIGTVENQNIRLVYDFDANTWSPEKLANKALIQATDEYAGVVKPYFFAENGRLYADEVGNLDDDKAIPMLAGTGRDMFQTEQMKRFTSILIFSKNATGLRVKAAVDDGQLLSLGMINKPVCLLKFPENGDNKLPMGVAFDWQIDGTQKGDAPKVYGAVVYYTTEEDIPSERRQQSLR